MSSLSLTPVRSLKGQIKRQAEVNEKLASYSHFDQTGDIIISGYLVIQCVWMILVGLKSVQFCIQECCIHCLHHSYAVIK